MILIPCGLYWTRTCVPLRLPSRNLNRRDCPPDRSLVSVDLEIGIIAATGGSDFSPIRCRSGEGILFQGFVLCGVSRELDRPVIHQHLKQRVLLDTLRNFPEEVQIPRGNPVKQVPVLVVEIRANAGKNQHINLPPYQ